MFSDGLSFVIPKLGFQSKSATVELHAGSTLFEKKLLNNLKFPIVAARRPFKGDDTPYFRNFLCNYFGSIKQLFKQGNMSFNPLTGFLTS